MTTGMFWRRSTLPFGVFLAVPGVLPLLASRSPRSFALQHVGYRKLPADALFDGEVPTMTFSPTNQRVLGLTLVQGQGSVPQGR